MIWRWWWPLHLSYSAPPSQHPWLADMWGRREERMIKFCLGNFKLWLYLSWLIDINQIIEYGHWSRLSYSWSHCRRWRSRWGWQWVAPPYNAPSPPPPLKPRLGTRRCSLAPETQKIRQCHCHFQRYHLTVTETILCLFHQGLHPFSKLVHVFENPLVDPAEGRHPLEICNPNLDSG